MKINSKNKTRRGQLVKTIIFSKNCPEVVWDTHLKSVAKFTSKNFPKIDHFKDLPNMETFTNLPNI